MWPKIQLENCKELEGPWHHMNQYNNTHHDKTHFADTKNGDTQHGGLNCDTQNNSIKTVSIQLSCVITLTAIYSDSHNQAHYTKYPQGKCHCA
jgi:hypothetical protein